MPLSFDEARVAAGKTAPQVAPRESGLAPAADKAGVKPLTGGIQFDVAGAKDAGYSEDEIASAISKKANFDKDAAEKAGYSPQDIINFLSPTAKGAEQGKELATNIKEDFGRDPSKAGQLTKEDVLNRVLAGGITGAATGAVLGLGVASIPLAVTGGITGALGGLLEAGAEQLGFGPGTQFLAGMGAAPVGATGKLAGALEGTIARYQGTLASKAVSKMSGIPLLGPATKSILKGVEETRPVDVKAAEKILGIKGTTTEAGLSEEAATVAKQEIANKFAKTTGQTIPENVDPERHIYNKAIETIDQLNLGNTDKFIGSSFFNRAAEIQGNINPAQVFKYKKIFQDAEGNALPGQDVINKLRAFKYGEDLPKGATYAAKDARFAEGEKLEKEFNGWLVKGQQTKGMQGAEPWQAHARGAYEQTYIAKARDSLPGLLEDVAKAETKSQTTSAGNALKDEIWNLSKTPEGTREFMSQFLGSAEKMPAKQTEQVWKQISPEVQKRMLKNPEQFKEINNIMLAGPGKREISRAKRIIMQAIPAATTDIMRNL